VEERFERFPLAGAELRVAEAVERGIEGGNGERHVLQECPFR
jgi:hypothetical protein